jgi:hypothetical protein
MAGFSSVISIAGLSNPNTGKDDDDDDYDDDDDNDLLTMLVQTFSPLHYIFPQP